MSGYRSYVPWPKSSAPTSYSYKKDSTTTPKYESCYTSRSRPEAKKSDDKSTSASSSLASGKYSAYSSGYQRDSSTHASALPTRSESTSRYKLSSTITDRTSAHPPITYRPLATRATASRSRDPSPSQDSTSTSGSYNPNRLYPPNRPSYTRPRSRESTDVTLSTTIPKYSAGRSGKDSGRISREVSREDLPGALASSSSGSSRYGAAKSGNSSSSRAPSREDLTKPASQKYINSRFLPKNTVEKSYTAYSRSSSARTNEVSRKNRELLNVLSASAQSEERSHRFSTQDDYREVSVVSRSTSPGLPSKTKRSDPDATNEKRITRSKHRPEMLDKEIQVETSRMAAVSRIATYLDLKYEEEGTKKTESPDTPKSLSRNSSSKSLSCSSSSSSNSKEKTKPKSKLTPPKSFHGDSKKQLPPQVPKCDAPAIKNAAQKCDAPATKNAAPNKDFRKSVLNMGVDGKSRKKTPKRSDSVNSNSESESGANSEATEVSESLSSFVAAPYASRSGSSSLSKLPQKVSQEEKGRRCSETSSGATSGSEDDAGKARASRSSSESKLKKLNLALARGASPEDSLSKPPISPSVSSRIKTAEGPRDEAEAKSFLMRALAPVTNLFKATSPRHDSSEKLNWMDSTCDNISEIRTDSVSSGILKSHRSTDPEEVQDQDHGGGSKRKAAKTKIQIRRVEESNSKSSKTPPPRIIRHLDSGDVPWWLQEHPDVPEGVAVWSATSVTPAGITEDGRTLYKVVRDDSSGGGGGKCWWFEDTEQSRSPSSISASDGPKLRLLRHIDSGEKAWWLDEDAEVPEGVRVYPEEGRPTNGGCRGGDSRDDSWLLDGDVLESAQISLADDDDDHDDRQSSQRLGQEEDAKHEQEEPEFLKRYKIRHIDSGERAWWLCSSENLDATERDADADSDGGGSSSACRVPLGDRASPEGLETPERDEDVGGTPSRHYTAKSNNKSSGDSRVKLFISKHTNIDDVLGGGSGRLLSPIMSGMFGYGEEKGGSEEEQQPYEEVHQAQVKIHEARGGAKEADRVGRLNAANRSPRNNSHVKLDDAALQLYKDGDYGAYLDLEASISEQAEEFEEFRSNKKNSIVLRTQLSVRVHTIIEKLLRSEGRELRRALFSLKQIFQEDKDLVHEFVQNDGLACLIKVGSQADQNYQNYILRALGQVMLYVDGMNGVMEHNETIQWLYTLISSKFRLVVKTALKLLLVFVEYTDTNCLLLIKAIRAVDYSQAVSPWYNIMKLLKDFDSADTELLIYATTLINKCLNGVPDQDTYYDQTDALEEQGIEAIIRRYMSKPGTDLDLLQQFQIYEAVLQYEDGEDERGTTPIRHLDENIRKTLRSRKSGAETVERRKSRRHSTGNTPVHSALLNNPPSNNSNNLNQTNEEDDDEESSSSQSSDVNNLNLNGSYKESNKDTCANNTHHHHQQRAINGGANVLNRNASRKDLTPILNAVNKIESEEGHAKQPWILSMMYGKPAQTQHHHHHHPHEEDEKTTERTSVDDEDSESNERGLLLQLKKENTVKDLTQKLVAHSPGDESKPNRVAMIGDMSGLISKAKEGLAKSKSQANVVKSPTVESVPKIEKKSENELRWEELAANLNRALNLCDLDFVDLTSDDENDIFTPVAVQNGIPPPPPPLLNTDSAGPAPPPPPLVSRIAPPPVPNPPVFGVTLTQQRAAGGGKQPGESSKIPTNSTATTAATSKKTKKTVKLFWKDVRDDPVICMKLKSGFIWDELAPVTVDTQKLEHLFESRAKDLISKKQQELNKNKEIIVLDPKRSNAINIGMTKLPQPRSIRTAILKMDATIMNREGIEKLLTMLPTEEERTKIQDAQAANPDLPLGSAEQFLLTLASISELPARLKLWAFKLDFENVEREIAEPLMDLKQGMEVLRVNKTFRAILSTLLSIGNFLNGNEVKGFQIEYLSKVPEVKDTVHKHSLLHHLCHIVMEKFPDASDLYSEIGAITRASKVDFEELALNVQRLEADCKASWDHLKLIAKHDVSHMMKTKMSEFLTDCAERIILLGIIHRRVLNRFHKFLLWLGIPLHQIADTRPNEFCRVISEFSLEYRTTRERVLQQLEKKANHRERNKTRGKMITETAKFRTKEDRADAELRQLLGSDISDVESMQGTLPWRRTRRQDSNRSFMGAQTVNGHLTDGDDEILESLVKTATKAPSRTAPRERKRTRHADRKSLKRSRTRENNPMGSRDSP